MDVEWAEISYHRGRERVWYMFVCMCVYMLSGLSIYSCDLGKNRQLPTEQKHRNILPDGRWCFLLLRSMDACAFHWRGCPHNECDVEPGFCFNLFKHGGSLTFIWADLWPDTRSWNFQNSQSDINTNAVRSVSVSHKCQAEIEIGEAQALPKR